MKNNRGFSLIELIVEVGGCLLNCLPIFGRSHIRFPFQFERGIQLQEVTVLADESRIVTQLRITSLDIHRSGNFRAQHNV